MPPSSSTTKKAVVSSSPDISQKTSVVKKTIAKVPVSKVVDKSVAPTLPVVASTHVAIPVPTKTGGAPVVEQDVSVVVDVQPVQQPTTPDNVLSTIVEKVNFLSGSFKELHSLLKVLSKEYEKQQKIIEKAQKKRQNAKNSPSGFAKPNKISDELCDFVGVPYGTEKSRTDITRFINLYVKEHNLNKPENKRFILPDDKLKKILNVGDNEEINYFILQKLISHHFPLSASKLAAAAATAVSVSSKV
jgi:hypothetical protein